MLWLGEFDYVVLGIRYESYEYINGACQEYKPWLTCLGRGVPVSGVELKLTGNCIRGL